VQPPEPESGAAARAALRVLVVDDDDAVRTVLCEVLREHTFDVVGEASNGLDGVALARELMPDVILLDVRMPRAGGLEAARMIRPRNADVRFVFLSAYDDPTFKQEAQEVGATAFLVKGCPLAEIVDAIAA
jgi:DNA-binding NarL/FixJ family response regulator